MMKKVLAIAGACACLAGAWVVPGAAHAREAEAASGSTRGLYLDLIRQARADGRPRAALAFLDDYGRRHGADAQADVLRVNCLLDLGDVREASAVLARLPKGSRGAQVGAEAARGHVSAALGDWQAAVRHYNAAVAANPAEADLLNGLGYAQLRAGMAAAATETLRAAFELSPTSPVIRNNLVLALTLGGQSSAAREILSRVADREALRALEAELQQESARIIASLAGGKAGEAAQQGETEEEKSS